MRAQHAAGDHQRGGGGDVRSGHRGPVPAGGQAELVRGERVQQGHLVDARERPAGLAVRAAGDAGVIAAAGGDEPSPGPVLE